MIYEIITYNYVIIEIMIMLLLIQNPKWIIIKRQLASTSFAPRNGKTWRLGASLAYQHCKNVNFLGVMQQFKDNKHKERVIIMLSDRV